MRTDGYEAAIVAATVGEASERIEIVAERRRAHDDVFRAMVVADALRPGARVQEVARRHRICPSLVYRWRRLIEPAQAVAPSAGFVPVNIMPVRADLTSPVSAASVSDRGGTIVSAQLPAHGKHRRDGTVMVSTIDEVDTIDERCLEPFET